jgi:hypothetical protein
MHELRRKPDRPRWLPGIPESVKEKADRGGTHLAAGLRNG